MASVRTIVITQADRDRLMGLIQRMEKNKSGETEYLTNLREELEKATIVDPHEVLADVITMNSTVRLRDLDDDEIMEVTLVYPHEADADENRVSVLAPVGTAIIGYQKGDIVEWPVPAGIIRLKVEEVIYQPERAGEFDR
jgi:regulator of nucleoside diphosphate kinase